MTTPCSTRMRVAAGIDAERHAHHHRPPTSIHHHSHNRESRLPATHNSATSTTAVSQTALQTYSQNPLTQTYTNRAPAPPAPPSNCKRMTHHIMHMHTITNTTTNRQDSASPHSPHARTDKQPRATPSCATGRSAERRMFARPFGNSHCTHNGAPTVSSPRGATTPKHPDQPPRREPRILHSADPPDVATPKHDSRLTAKPTPTLSSEIHDQNFHDHPQTFLWRVVV